MAEDAKPDGAQAKPEWETSADGRPKQFSIPPELVEHILLGPADDRRVLQDSPLLGDVWAAYALDPGNIQDVLITPHKTTTAATVASLIPGGQEKRDRQRESETDPKPIEHDKEKAKIAYLQGLVGARLYFDEVLCILVPLTQWWRQPQVEGRIRQIDQKKLVRLLQRPIAKVAPSPNDKEIFSSLDRYVALAGLLYWIGKLERPDDCKRAATPPGQKQLAPLPPLPKLDTKKVFERYQDYAKEIIEGIVLAYPAVLENSAQLLAESSDDPDADAEANAEGYIFQVSLNRIASPALDRSVPAVKADAAQSLFKVSCKNIVWAVLDSGINGKHPAFQIPDPASKARDGAAAIATAGAASGQADTRGENDTAATGTTPLVTAQAGTGEAKGGKAATPAAPAPLKSLSRVRKTFDFTQIREIVSNDPHDIEDDDVMRVAKATGLSEDKVRETLETISEDARKKRPINWGSVEKLITIKLPPDPMSPHGTHVAGIVGADKHGVGVEDGHGADGMCPDIRIYDFRVLGKNLEDTEFAIIAALQYIRYVNERHTKITIHGANLSLSIPHNVHNYACGRTPVCNECERLIESGVVVVAPAGNHGYQKFETSGGVVFENYAAFSITDPGNADGVITVGSTHGNWPQTYGVSFFSSRGPTGDGRLKPDLVAPGERVQSTVLGKDWGPESGTSMAAPHVSGAAAMLLARYEELIGQPRRVKRILCESATDLGREKSFQGHGMLDVLRAFQSI